VLLSCHSANRPILSCPLGKSAFAVASLPRLPACVYVPTQQDFQDNYNHMIQTFEMAVRCMPPGVEQWVWMCDFHGGWVGGGVRPPPGGSARLSDLESRGRMALLSW
jgi:hypothetical protein